VTPRRSGPHGGPHNQHWLGGSHQRPAPAEGGPARRSLGEGGRWPSTVWVAAGALFAILATANGGGYRYGVSDQAFYIPVVMRALDPAAFPRDSGLIDAQGRLMVADEVLAASMRVTGFPLEVLFLGAYLL
jgi:hypothetical protein